MHMHYKKWIVILLMAVGVYACNKEQQANVVEPFSGFQKPDHFPLPVYDFANNPITKEGFELGRKLFYENKLSGNNTVSCGSCHIQTAAFTHHGHSVSHGIFDRLGVRNSPPIMNLAWSKTFMWDGGVFNLDLQPIAPITNHVEMEDSVEHVLSKLRQDSRYPPLFKKAYGREEITTARFLKALSQFMLMCVSSNSKYDSVMRHKSQFTTNEQSGYALFQQKCASCHAEPLFTDNSFRNNGLSISMVNDEGRYAITLNAADKYKFKVPSLRNLQYTPPYMHDGRLLTLEGVLDHYAGQVQNTLNLDPSLRQANGQLGIPLTTDEKANIISFLLTLSDKSFLTNKQLSEQ